MHEYKWNGITVLITKKTQSLINFISRIKNGSQFEVLKCKYYKCYSIHVWALQYRKTPNFGTKEIFAVNTLKIKLRGSTMVYYR